MQIKITINKLTVFAELNASKTAQLIWDSLPLEADAELWGDEVYFYIKPKTGIEKEYARQVVEVGDVAYWPQGPCMCLFFGMTPNSRDGKIMPASAVNVFGKLKTDPLVLKQVKEGQRIKVEQA
ncbi:MAG: cyclophilin-like fold protein [Candidatus Omnitrophica bacterium]|nr:cyclophilin-like fold protein [Candidatus Omnitrophota bacterium]